MTKFTTLALAIATLSACSTDSTVKGKPPTGAPRMAKGMLPMSGAMKPKTISAVKEMAGKPVVAMRSPVATSGSFNLTLEVGVRYMFVITLEQGEMIQLFASDSATQYSSWLPIGNSLAGGVDLDFGSLTIVQNTFISTTVLLGMDWDADGISDFADSDDDNDGISDDNDYDIDGDGIDDDYLDADGDGQCNLVDDDDDNDGVSDDEDTDDDGDGISDASDDIDVDIDGDGDDDSGDDGDDGDDGDGGE